MKYHIFLIITTILIIELCNIYICKIASFGNKNITIHKNYKYIFFNKTINLLDNNIHKITITTILYIVLHSKS